MVQFEGIWIIHLPDLLFGNFPGKVKDSSFVSAAPVLLSPLHLVATVDSGFSHATRVGWVEIRIIL